MLEYVLNTPRNVFCQYCSWKKGLRSWTVLWSKCLASWSSPITAFDRLRNSKRKDHIWWVEHFALFLCFFFFCFSFSFRSVHGVCEWMCEWMSLQCHSCAQTLDRGERCLGPDLQCPRSWHHQAPRVRVTRISLGSCLSLAGKGYCGGC